MVFHSYANECSKLCSDIFPTVGRKNTFEPSRLYVVDEVNENVYLHMVKSEMNRINLVSSNKR